MKFGSVPNPSIIDFSLPSDHPATAVVLDQARGKEFRAFVGCAKWNKTDLKNFYPKGIKDELAYYSSQFNSIELNATFYRLFPKDQFDSWREKVPEGFRFFPKITNTISHLKRLLDNQPLIDEYIDHTLLLKEKLGTVFLQMHDNFQPKNWDRVVDFTGNWPKEVPLAIEFRHTDWFNKSDVSERLYALLEEKKMANVLVDTAGRRDIMHMRLTTPEAFVRFVSANHPSDYDRMETWIDRILSWRDQGLEQLDFFIHQNNEKESPLLSSYFIKRMNEKLGTTLHIPNERQNTLKLDL